MLQQKKKKTCYPNNRHEIHLDTIVYTNKISQSIPIKTEINKCAYVYNVKTSTDCRC